MRNAQEQTLRLQNKNRIRKEYESGDVIYVRTNRRNKTAPKYTKQIVKENKNNTIINSKGKEIHKDNIRK